MPDRADFDKPDFNSPDLDRPDLDRLIDEALHTYASADSGLEQRVLVHIAIGRESPPRLRWKAWPGIGWAVALTVAACLLVVIALMHPRPAPAPSVNAFNTPPVQQAPNADGRPEPQTTQERSAPLRRAPAERAPRILAANRVPKRDVFPTPRQLSPAEQVLADFAAQAPKAEREAFLGDRKQTSGPIAIAEIRIAPIQIQPIEPPRAGAN